MTTVTHEIHFARKTRHKVIKTGPPPEPSPPTGRIPRVSKLMALAIRFDKMLVNGEVASMSDLARLTRVTQPRMTQIMNLLHLAPDIQEELLNLPLVHTGNDTITERDVRPITRNTEWVDQRTTWRLLKLRYRDAVIAHRVALPP
ncbi:hypothetical protein [Mucisphaera calidilacus]|uniref:Uncharacterized protein n=1 Tax=Mucisphaera calidilacus TaxID=2527982 RepID=A0A518BVU4_9BACT|nr:hypothetical protein [Mucisphaera calidilacus]QDU71081.1 hypothetical protein Pan265_09260 [Mucisphaera calidilacus]